MQNDLTTGSVFRNVVSFSLPYLLSYFLQTLYGMADLFIIGQFEGVASTTAVSIGSQVMHMLTVMLVGLAMGATVSIAQAAGGGDKKRTASAIGNTVTLFMLLSLALTALLLALRGSIVSIMSTPEEAVQGTLAYLTVCFIGIPFITAYNIIASIFRGLGDSKSPMYFIAVACVVNIALDYYFMGTLHLGPAGAALGTTLSQAVSVLVSLAVILKRRLISVRRADFRPQRAVMGKLQTSRRAPEQRDPGRSREPLELKRDAGLGEMQKFGCARDIPLPRNGEESLQNTKVECMHHYNF